MSTTDGKQSSNSASCAYQKQYNVSSEIVFAVGAATNSDVAVIKSQSETVVNGTAKQLRDIILSTYSKNRRILHMPSASNFPIDK